MYIHLSTFKTEILFKDNYNYNTELFHSVNTRTI